MPSFKQPNSLQEQCVRSASRLVRDACLQIQSKYKHSETERLHEARLVQRHLLVYIRPVMDQICAHVFTKSRRYNMGGLWVTILCVFSHSSVKRLCYRNFGHLELGKFFWESSIQSVPNLIELDLSSLIYVQHGSMRTIINNCQKLQIIVLPFLCVSSEDFCLLEGIKTLRIIKNRCVHEASSKLSHKFGYTYKQTGVAHLLSHLPCLEYIDCNCLGVALRGLNRGELPSLLYCWEMEPTRDLVETISQTCPNLKDLVLGNYFRSHSACSLAPLGESSLKVSTLVLLNFSFNGLTDNFLSRKGIFLRSLELCYIPEINADQIQTIGKHCTHLQCLTIYLRSNPSKFGANSGSGSPICQFNELMFEHLVKFDFSADEISGQTYVGTMLCLVHAKRIESIVFKEGASVYLTSNSTLENCISDLIVHNSLGHLESLILRGRNLILSTKIIQHLYDLPRIKTLTLKMNHNKDTFAYLDGLNFNIASKNLDLKIKYF